MKQGNVEKIVMNGLKKIEIPIPHRTLIKPIGNAIGNPVYFYVTINIDKNPNKLNEVSGVSYCDFNLFNQRDYLEPENLKLTGEMKGKGFGRKLVEFMEEIARQTNRNSIQVHYCKNIPFWEHMGYMRVEKGPREEMWIKEL